MKTQNKQIAIEPFKKERTEERKMVRGLDMTDVSTTKLIESTVLWDSDNYKKGDVVYFRSEIMRHPYTNVRLSLGETVFVLIPEELVVMKKSANA